MSISLSEQCTPGHEGYAVPDTIDANWQVIPVEQPAIDVAKDMVSKGDGPVSFGIFGPQQGLPHAIRQLLVTRDGNLWIGSIRGLTKYNGHSFSHYFFLKTPQTISCLFEDRGGQIWVTT
ncbi:MAG: two-component regulator propeller domain-containing protein, partial [Saprospiraceae bacterium]|nr:two-component regulator propeller domain-containing protein [Saprospiraceae bacterium]